MTDIQKTVLDEITEKMREHFDSAVFIFETDAAKDDDPTLVHISYRTSGSFCAGLGLLEYCKDKMLNDEKNV